MPQLKSNIRHTRKSLQTRVCFLRFNFTLHFQRAVLQKSRRQVHRSGLEYLWIWNAVSVRSSWLDQTDADVWILRARARPVQARKDLQSLETKHTELEVRVRGQHRRLLEARGVKLTAACFGNHRGSLEHRQHELREHRDWARDRACVRVCHLHPCIDWLQPQESQTNDDAILLHDFNSILAGGLHSVLLLEEL